MSRLDSRHCPTIPLQSVRAVCHWSNRGSTGRPFVDESCYRYNAREKVKRLTSRRKGMFLARPERLSPEDWSRRHYCTCPIVIAAKSKPRDFEYAIFYSLPRAGQCNLAMKGALLLGRAVSVFPFPSWNCIPLS